MSAGKYKITTKDHGELYVGSREATKEYAIHYVKHEYGIARKDILSCKLSPAHKAREIYIKAIQQADGDLDSAALIADEKGYNRACDFQEEWIEAIALA